MRVKWPPRINVLLCVIGLGVASYLTYEHYSGSKSLACPAHGGKINCLKVTTSVYSKIHGVPVADLGLAFFVVMLALQVPRAWNTSLRWVPWARMGWCLVGVGTAMWLIYAELFKLDAICEWCTSVHFISLIVFIVTAFGTATATSGDYDDEYDDDVEEETSGAPSSSRA